MNEYALVSNFKILLYEIFLYLKILSTDRLISKDEFMPFQRISLRQSIIIDKTK